MSSTNVLRLTLRCVPPPILYPNAARRASRYQVAAAAADLRMRAGWEARDALADPLGAPVPVFLGAVRVRVRVAWPPGRRRPDTDALANAVKPILDGLTDAGLWRSDAQIAEICYTQSRSSGGRVIVEIRQPTGSD